jgi:hypothetical protein
MWPLLQRSSSSPTNDWLSNITQIEMRDRIRRRNSSSLVKFRSKRTKVAIELIKLGIMLIYIRPLKIGAAYETLKDESKRRQYDLSRPKFRSKSTTFTPNNTQGYTSSPKPASSDYHDESQAAAAIAAIQKSKYERASRWWKKRAEFDNEIGELKREGQKLRDAIRHFEEITKAEDAEKAAESSWATWLLSPVYKRPIVTEEEKEHKARDRLQRVHAKSFKERDLKKVEEKLKEKEEVYALFRQEFDNANRKDDAAKARIEDRIRSIRTRELLEKMKIEREERERVRREQFEKERVEREKREKLWREQREKQEREAAKAEHERLKQMVEQAKKKAAGTAARKKQEELLNRAGRRATRSGQEVDIETFHSSASIFNAAAGGCLHDGWWAKVEGRRACSRCSITYGYLLECPGCQMKACASCQKDLRPLKRNRAGMNSSKTRRHSTKTPYAEYSYTNDSYYNYEPTYDWD